MRETTPHHCLDLLGAVFRACRQMALSESFRNTLPGKRARFFQPRPMEDWNRLLRGLVDEPEFRIARAVASIQGTPKKQGEKDAAAQPMLGSLLPLALEKWGWHLPLPPKEKPSKQAVWTGADVCHDLAAVLARRYLDSLRDERPALVSALGAPLGDVLAFLRGELDPQLVARWIEALSLIGWKPPTVDEPAPAGEPESHVIPVEYAALRTLLELECEWQGEDRSAWKKRRSQQPIALLCQRSASTLPPAVTEALRWIAIWGVPNPDQKARTERGRLAGRDIISLPVSAFRPSVPPSRLAAAVCIPLHWRDRETLFRAVSLPQAA